MTAIDRLHQAAAALADVAATAVVHGTLLAIAAAVIAATALRRARPAAHAALWLVVLLKFVVPFGPGARFSLASLYERATAAEAAPTVTMVLTPGATAAAPTPPAAPAPRHPIALGRVAAWALSGTALLGRELARARRARARAASHAPAPAELAATVAALARRLGVRRPIDLRVAAVASPHVVGARRPIVVVPQALCADPPRLTAALAHELAHVRRADAAVRVIQRVVAALFFFWPVVRWVNRRLDLAREQACDAYAISHGPLDASAYARLLIAVARQHAPAAALGLGGSQLARRVHALARPQPTGVGALGALAVAGFAAVGLTTAGAARADAAPSDVRVCVFTPELAAEILVSYPEADIDRDGELSRTEVCDFQQAMRRRFVDDALADLPIDGVVRDRLAARLPMRSLPAAFIDEASPLASDQLCCNCSAPDGATPTTQAPGQPAEFNPAIATCPRGVDP